MGAERWLEFKGPSDIMAAREFVKKLNGYVELESPKCDCDLFWGEGERLEVSHRFGEEDEILAAFVCREFARRFNVSRIGADSTDWYEDKDWKATGKHSPTKRYGPYTSWVDWIKDFKPEWDSPTWNLYSPEEQEEFRKIGKAVEALFEEKSA